MGPIDAALQGKQCWIWIKTNAPVWDALSNFGTLIKILGQRPTHYRELVVDIPGYVGYCDASKLGAGGVWLSGTFHLSPIVWHIKWPPDIQANVVSFQNPKGNNHKLGSQNGWHAVTFPSS
jgi:hypothetical protein